MCKYKCFISVSGRDPSKINKPLRPDRKTIEEWLKFIVEHQFTLQEIEDGVDI